MDNTADHRPEPTNQERPAPAESQSNEERHDSPDGRTEQAAGAVTTSPREAPPKSSETKRPRRRLRRWLIFVGGVIVLAVGAYFLYPWLIKALNTVSTDNAYVNSHVTFVAPRVSGQVVKVLVDDNYRVKKGDLLVQLDKEPYQVQLEIKQAVVKTAEADLAAAQAQVRAQIGQARSVRYKLEHAMEDVNNQIANLRATVATLQS